MTIVRVKGFQIFKDRHGRWRCYHRATRTAVDLEKAPLGSAAFFAECAKIAEAVEAKAEQAKPGTLGMLIGLYRSHRAFTELAPRTQKDYQRIFSYLQPIADTPLARFDAPTIARIRDKAGERGYRHGNYVKQVLSILLGWGAERGHVNENAAQKVKGLSRPKGKASANRPWSDDELHAVLGAAHSHLRPVLALMAYTGLGPKDAVRLPRTALKDGRISTQRSKTGEQVYWPCPAPLLVELAAMPPHDAVTVCASSHGKPWTQDGLQTAFQRLKGKLEEDGAVQPGLTLYGLRHTVAVVLRELGFDERTIADALGQKTIEMARHYAKGADLRKKMDGVVVPYSTELDRRRTKSVKPK